MDNFIEAVIEAIRQVTIDESVPVSVDIDERGSRTRISITVEKNGEVGVVKTRRYQ